MTDTMLKELLYLDSTVPIGSIALGVANEDSDLDLCVYGLDVPKTYLDTLSTVVPKEYDGYSRSLLLQNSTLYTNDTVDIFVFTDYEKLAIVSKVMFSMKNYPKMILRIKWIRVKLFRYLLTKNGFIDEKPNRSPAYIGTKDV